MIHEVYGYHEANTEPVSSDSNIFGMELELDDRRENVRQILDTQIDRNIITAPCNEELTRGLKVIENDSSVYKEIILCADTPENILKCVENLNRHGLKPETVRNSTGTSNHIHINKELLEMKGITIKNLYKCIEFYNPFIFAVSGRNIHNWHNWAEPITPTPTLNIDWEQHGANVSGVHHLPTGRYHLVNPTEYTVEMRGFSNAHNFSYDMISFYLDCIQFFISQAESMKGLYYVEEWERLIEDLKQFLTAYPEIVDKYQLKKLFHRSKSLSHGLDILKVLRFSTRHNRKETEARDILWRIQHGDSRRGIIKAYVDFIFQFRIPKKQIPTTIKGVKRNIMAEMYKFNRTAEYMAVFYTIEQDLRILGVI